MFQGSAVRAGEGGEVNLVWIRKSYILGACKLRKGSAWVEWKKKKLTWTESILKLF